MLNSMILTTISYLYKIQSRDKRKKKHIKLVFDNNGPQVSSDISGNSQVNGIQVSTLLNALLSNIIIHFL